MENSSKHILVLIKFHPERELRLLQEFCKDGYTYDVVAPSFRIAADWDWMVRNESMQPPQKVLVLPELVEQLKGSGSVGKQHPGISGEMYEKAVVVDKAMSKWRSSSKVNFFLNCYLYIINRHLVLEGYSSIIGEISSAFEFLLFQKAKSLGVPYAYFIASPFTPNTFSLLTINIRSKS